MADFIEADSEDWMEVAGLRVSGSGASVLGQVRVLIPLLQQCKLN